MKYMFLYDGPEYELYTQGIIDELKIAVKDFGFILITNTCKPGKDIRLMSCGNYEGLKLLKTFLGITVIFNKDANQEELTDKLSLLTRRYRGLELDAFKATAEDCPALEINGGLTSQQCMVKIYPWYIDALINHSWGTSDVLNQILAGGVKQVHYSKHINSVSIEYTRSPFPNDETNLSLVTQMILSTADKLTPLYQKHQDFVDSYSLTMINGKFSGYSACLEDSFLKIREPMTSAEIDEVLRARGDMNTKMPSPVSSFPPPEIVAAESIADKTVQLLISSTGICTGWNIYKKGTVILLEHANKQNLETIQKVLVKKDICESSCMRNAMTKSPILKLTNINHFIAKRELSDLIIELEESNEKQTSTSAVMK
jgi:hypothetical protein